MCSYFSPLPPGVSDTSILSRRAQFFLSFHRPNNRWEFFSKYYHMSIQTSWSPSPGCGRSVTDFWGWDAHRARLRCPDGVSDDMCERGVPGGALNLSSTSYPDHGCCGDPPLQGKIPTAEPAIELRTSWLVVRSSDHQATRLVPLRKYFYSLFDTLQISQETILKYEKYWGCHWPTPLAPHRFEVTPMKPHVEAFP
jgi:hypothetical protein